MISRFALLRDVFRTRTSKVLTFALGFMAAYQFACDQFGAPTLPNLWGMSGAAALPWWAWLLLAQLGFLYGLFEYVRAMELEPAPASTGSGPDPASAAAAQNARALSVICSVRSAAHVATWQGNETSRAKVAHEFEAAMLTIENLFGIPGLKIPKNLVTHRDAMDTFVRYIDSFYPLLRDGHAEKAREKAAEFKNPFVA